MPVSQINEKCYRRFSASGKLFARMIISVPTSRKKMYHPNFKLASNESTYFQGFQDTFLYRQLITTPVCAVPAHRGLSLRDTVPNPQPANGALTGREPLFWLFCALPVVCLVSIRCRYVLVTLISLRQSHLCFIPGPQNAAQLWPAVFLGGGA